MSTKINGIIVHHEDGRTLCWEDLRGKMATIELNHNQLSVEIRENRILEKWEKEYESRRIKYGNFIINKSIESIILNKYYDQKGVVESIYKGLKRDGQWNRYFLSLFRTLHWALRGKTNHDFVDSKIPMDEKEFMLALRDVVDFRIQVLEEQNELV